MKQKLASGDVEETNAMKMVSKINLKSTSEEQVFVYRPPSVEIRLSNQVKDDFLELITSTGTQTIPIHRDGMIETVKMLENRMLTGSLIILVFGLIVAAYFSHHLSFPLRELSSAAEAVASGELGTTIDTQRTFTSSEIKSTVIAFNQMSKQLAEVEQLKSRVRENEHYRELGEIARGLAHSIRNPLNTLGLSVEELSRDDLKVEIRTKLVDSATRQISRIDHWIRSFMTFSLSGNTESSLISLMPLIQDIRLEASQLENRKVAFIIDSPDTLEIEGVEAEVKAILHALIINAIEASPINSEISLTVSVTAKNITFDILDQGEGIPEEIRENLFQPHQTTKARGSGMGLYMAHRLATGRYDGSIEIKDREPKGTAVKLVLAKHRTT